MARTGRPPALNEQQQREVAEALDDGARARPLAEKYGVSAATITRLLPDWRRRGPRLDLTGQVFGQWTVQGWAPATGTVRGAWLCRCTCGRQVRVHLGNLKSGQSTRCRICANKELNQRRQGMPLGSLRPRP